MRINDQNLTGASAAGAGRAQETQRADRGGGSRPAGASAGEDRVELSSSLGSLSRALATHQTDRAARVQKLAADYQTGRYRLDAAATGRAMVADAMAPARD